MVIKSPYPDVETPNVDVWNLLFENPTISPRNRVPNDKVIIIDPIKERQFTFGQLRTLTQRVAQNLHARLHWQKGDCLAIYAPNCPEYIIAMVGGIAAASTVSPASVSFGVDELTFQLQDSGAKALITHASVLDTALKAATASGIPRSNIFVIPEDPSTSDPAGGVVSFDSLLASNRSTRWVPPSINIRDDLVALPYSSGTTGRPKGVRLSHYNVVSNVFSMAIAWNDGIIDVPPSDDHFISVLPFSHVYGMAVLIFMSVLSGRTQIILPRFDLITYCELTQKYRCNVGYIVPPILTAFAKHPLVDKYDLSSLSKGGLMCAAAPLSVSIIDAVYDRLKIPVYQAMGMTEASPATHIMTIHNWQQGKGGVGLLVPNVEARLVNESGNDVRPGDSGELWVRGPNIFLGYHKNPAATADCMTTDGYYKTGDIARIDPETNHFYVTDRVKELIKYKGYQVPPAELEGVLNSNSKVADVAVVGYWNEEEQTEVPRAFIVLQAGNEASKELAQEIARWLEGRVAHYKRLRGGIRFVAEIPKNPSGKILRRLLKQQMAAEAVATKAKL